MSLIDFDIEADGLAVFEALKSGTLDRADMDEHIRSTVFRFDKSVPFGPVKPFDRSCFHFAFPFIIRLAGLRAGRELAPL